MKIIKNNFYFKEYSILLDKDYFEQFFIGLLEGDGTITVDYINNLKKRVRIFISLKNIKDNVNMLNIIFEHIGGRVKLERNNTYVTWYATSRIDIDKVFMIISKYPFLTTRKQCQYQFAKRFVKNKVLESINKEEFYVLRDNKYLNQENLLDLYNKNFLLPPYFPSWLSGFIEAEGHFKLVKYSNNTIKSSQFVIGQNKEKYILKAILTYFKVEHIKICYSLNKKGKNITYYKIHIGGKYFRDLLKTHFSLFPLLGDKLNKYVLWDSKH